MHLSEIERLLKLRQETDAENDIQEIDENLNKHLEIMISVLDTNATYQYQEDELDTSRGTPKSHQEKRHTFSISMDTILRGSALKSEEMSLGLDEQLKARFLTRIFREYRRNLEIDRIKSS